MARLDTGGDLNANNLDAQQPIGSEIKQKLYDSGQATGDKLSEKAQALSAKAVNLGEQQKSIGAQQLAGVASAVHTAATELEGRMPQAADFVHTAADKLDSVAAALRDRRLDELLSDVSEFTRDRPWLVFGGAVLAGFAMTRFVKSSAGQTRQTVDQEKFPSRATSSNSTDDRSAQKRKTSLPTGDTIDRSYEGTA